MKSHVPRLGPWAVLSAVLWLATSCASPAPDPTTTLLPATNTKAATETDTATPTASVTLTPTESDTPTVTLSPTVTETATAEPLTVEAVEGNANCRWGPGTAYIEFTTFQKGDKVLVEGRDYTNSWVYIHPTGLEGGCWVALSAVVLSGDIRAVGLVVPNLYPSDEVPVPGGVTAERNGGKVTFSWNAVANAPEVGYLLEVIQCLNGFAINASYATDNTSITLNDGTDCSVKSEGTLRSKNKLGYSRSVELPWP